MIGSFRDAWLEAFFVRDRMPRQIPADIQERLFRKLQMLDDATTDADLRSPPSNHFERLQGSLRAYHSIRVNRQWRLVFHWDGEKGEASDVYLDNHSYR
ncbi:MULTISPECIES: type II toxin-antitoxin system RelE/ParE family toxin [unclassified Pseudomonas]|uniref:type II toxin-antitoxin system RelE/ParE family toxin n=1 Tax=unclassified Pseudomonas TaxID=196821 RepID=UPI0002A3C3DA|nr:MULTISPECIES: type II toxin-antitoxin system RelE/ParE family toxin [unclassified Pseudomonas]MBB1609295.1 plasmid maintenance system killer protein [Pseudomonas sp. UMC76]MBB1640263.1 plasmid maintenance system killer protein [Pseudomonas sp. UME83]NTX89311.1 type II toxin-antitoxin system RelE/ParE family toxin [Pseudomonas sp. UMA643]NTY20189.1 type II toxin-antitoxin system RelE/ParE family toxin [Pseudomonas sp. UMC3103]NTY25848.1 type II toxin-antitoxin system RelE/ParE family toxin [